MQWHELFDTNSNLDGSFFAFARVKQDSPWFEGHFPDMPVLPGIAQIGLVVQVLERFYVGQRVECTGLKNVRFKKAVAPDELLRIKIDPESTDSPTFRFKITHNQELACSGKIVVQIRPNSGPQAE